MIGDLSNKRVAILGLAMEGAAVALFLRGKTGSLTILDQASREEMIAKASADTRESIEAALSDPGIGQVLGNHYMDNLADYDVIFRTPGISYNHPKLQEAREKGVEISSQIKLFFELCPATIIGVTGTKGKGTTSSLIYSILERSSKRAYVAGNIGYPAIALMDRLRPEDYVVLELSSFQLMDLDRSPRIAVVVNLGEDHLNYHKDVDEYEEAKFTILRYQGKGDFAVLNKRSTFREEWLREVKSDISCFSGDDDGSRAVVREGSDGVLEAVLDPNGRNLIICRLPEIKLVGRHNLENIGAAAIVADLLGVEIRVIQEVVRDFSGLPHRLEFVREVDGVRYIEDSFATTLGPTIAAIRAFPEDKILILGGSSKGADFRELAEEIVKSNIPGVVLIGDQAEKIEKTLEAAGYSGKMVPGGTTIDEIVGVARGLAQSGDLVIFSPACASFGLFKDYKDRGDQFKAAVKKLT